MKVKSVYILNRKKKVIMLSKMASDVKLNINSFKNLFNEFHIRFLSYIVKGNNFPLCSVINVS